MKPNLIWTKLRFFITHTMAVDKIRIVSRRGPPQDLRGIKISFPLLLSLMWMRPKCAENYFSHTTQNSEAFKKPFFCYKKIRC